MLADAGIIPGVMKPFVVLVENGGNAQAIAAKVAQGRRHRRRRRAGSVAARAGLARRGVPGDRRRRARRSRRSIDRVNDALDGTNGDARRPAAVDRDFVHAVYGNFPYVLAFVVILTLILLTRAFRSIVLPIKAAILNLISLARGVRDHRLHLPEGPRLRALEHHGDAGDHRLDPADDLRVPVRPLDGLRGLHAHAHAGGLRRDGLDRARRSSSASPARASSSRARR